MASSEGANSGKENKVLEKEIKGIEVLPRRLGPHRLEWSDMLYAKTQKNHGIRGKVKVCMSANEVATQ